MTTSMQDDALRIGTPIKTQLCIDVVGCLAMNRKKCKLRHLLVGFGATPSLYALDGFVQGLLREFSEQFVARKGLPQVFGDARKKLLLNAIYDLEVLAETSAVRLRGAIAILLDKLPVATEYVPSR